MNLLRPSPRRGIVLGLTPMTDVVLQLIIFFLYTAQYSRLHVTQIELPREPGDAEATTQGGIVVDLKADGTLLVERRAIPLGRVIAMIEADLKTSGDGGELNLVIRADRACPAEHLNNLARALSERGVTGWKLATTGPGGMR